MEKEETNSFRIVLTETLMIIGVFAVISAFLIQMFAVTNRIRQKAVNISKAMIQTESVAENIKNSASVAEVANQLSMTACDTIGSVYCMYFDQNWTPCNQPSDHILIVTSNVTRTEYGRLVHATVSSYEENTVEAIQGKGPFTALDVVKYVAGQ